MKKTRKTILTSALLSAALAMQGEIQNPDSKLIASVIPEPTYGPPVATGDLNYDGSINIADFILYKSSLLTDDTLSEDFNHDGIIDAKDVKAFQRYLFGRIPDLDQAYPDPDEEDTPVPQTTYGPPRATETEPIMQTKYGPPSWMITDIAEPDVTTVPEQEILPITAMTSEIEQCVYGPPSAFFDNEVTE